MSNYEDKDEGGHVSTRRTHSTPPTVIVSRHAGAVEWLRLRGFEGKVIAQASRYDVEGCIVVGSLPLWLASTAAEVWAIDMPNLTEAQRGKDLTPAEMDAAGASITQYRVTRGRTLMADSWEE
jgi:CRISPR-associated protein Csx16